MKITFPNIANIWTANWLILARRKWLCRTRWPIWHAGNILLSNCSQKLIVVIVQNNVDSTVQAKNSHFEPLLVHFTGQSSAPKLWKASWVVRWCCQLLRRAVFVHFHAEIKQRSSKVDHFPKRWTLLFNTFAYCFVHVQHIFPLLFCCSC